MNRDVLAAVVALARSEDRRAASQRLAALLGGRDLLVFVRDAEVGALLPAPGFPQTLPNTRHWRRWLDTVVARGVDATPDIPRPPDGLPTPAVGLAVDAEAAIVVLGAEQPNAAASDLCDLLPLLSAAFERERFAARARTQSALAQQAAQHAESLARALDLARRDLQQSLAESQKARRELELANSQLQDQAVELEVQSEVLAQHADQLQAANQALEIARVAADTANRAKSEFLTTMSHELRTPLNAIGGHAQLIEVGVYGPVTDAQRDALRRINRSQRHLLGLINDILNLARIEAGRVAFKIEDVAVSELLKDLAPMIEPQLRDKQLRYTVVADDPSLIARADREKTQQVLLNLLSNAVKFTPVGGAITVSARRSDGHVQIEVADTGVGIPADKQSAIFEPFIQVDSSHSRSNEGTGLGLAISRDLARGMGGELSVQSSHGAGSSFIFQVPAAPSTIAQTV